MAYGVARFIPGNRGIDRSGVARMTETGIWPGMFRRIVIGIDDMTCGASAIAIISRLIVGPGETQQRIEQSGLLQSEKNRIRAQKRSESSLAKFPRDQRSAWRLSQ